MIYFDTSAVVKLVVPEPETAALQEWMASRRAKAFFSSQLLHIELSRTVGRAAPERIDRASDVLKGFVLLRIDDEVVEGAVALQPPNLRTLDAIHLATALMVRKDVSAFVAKIDA